MQITILTGVSMLTLHEAAVHASQTRSFGLRRSDAHVLSQHDKGVQKCGCEVPAALLLLYCCSILEGLMSRNMQTGA